MRYFMGGGAYGIAPTYTDELIEDLTGMPLHESFNMFAGSSIGSHNSAALAMPKYPGAKQAKMTAREFRYSLMDVSRKIFPHKRAYYARQAIADIAKLAFEFVVKVEEMAARKLDKMINRGIASIWKAMSHVVSSTSKYTLNPLKHKMVNDGLDGAYPAVIRPFRSIYNNVFLPFNKLMDRGLEYLLEKSRYDIDELHAQLRERFTDPATGVEPKLGNSLISYHVTSYNYTLDEPAYFFHYRDPVTLESQHVSDPELRASDMLCRSSAAQTVFQPFHGDNGDIYFDIAHFDNASSANSDLKGHLPERYTPKILIVGTGRKEYNVDGQDMRNMLFFRQLAGPLGAALIGIPQKHIQKKEMKDLAREIGEENIVTIDRSLNEEDYVEKYKHMRKDGAFRTLVPLFGAEAIRESAHNEIENVPDSPFFDTRPHQIEKINKFGFAMAWENAVQIIKFSRELVESAAIYKRITPAEAKEKLEAIDRLFTTDPEENEELYGEPANSNEAPSEAELRQQRISAYKKDLYEKWPFLEDLKTYFNATGTKLEDYDETPFVPLRFGTALSNPKELLNKAARKDTDSNTPSPPIAHHERPSPNSAVA